MNEKELKSLIKEVVRECVNETSAQIPKGKLAKLNPTIIQKQGDKKMKLPQKGSSIKLSPKVKESGLTSEKTEKCDCCGDKSCNCSNAEKTSSEIGDIKEYSEDEEMRLIRGLNLITKKLLDMHQGVGSKEHGEEDLDESNGGPQYKVVSPTAVNTAKEDKAREVQRNPKVNESGHKVQHRSSKTIKDLDNNPKNVRDPEVPQA